MNVAEIFFSEFTLTSEHFWNSQSQCKLRKGVLLKIQFDRNLVGYSCYNPWPELGDETYQEGLALLKKGEMTHLLTQSFYWADVDAKARIENISLRDSIQPLKNHFLVQDIEQFIKDKNQEILKRFSVFKIKMGRDLKKEASLLSAILNNIAEFQARKVSDIKLRLDFNGKMSFEEFNLWYKSLPIEIKSQIDFIEDAFDPRTCVDLNELKNPLYAWDFYHSKIVDPKTVIVKPTRFLPKITQDQRRVFTHSFDHPIGIVISHFAASQSAEAYQEIHGLNFENVQCSDGSHQDFSFDQNKMIIKKSGSGFGFDELFKDTKWQAL